MGHILVIDIGSYKTTAIIATDNGNELSISGIGISSSKGVKRGTINNIEEASKSIKHALNDAKRIAGIDINKAIVSISSTYVQSIFSEGIVNIPEGEIRIKEINRAIQAALYNASIPSDYVQLHAIPYKFILNDNEEVEDPDGMNGNRLQVKLHIMIAKKNGIENLKKAFKLAGVEIINIINSAYASSLAVLNNDEKELGSCVIDIGSTTSDIAIFYENSIQYVDFLGVGSHHITHDLSVALHTPISIAEKIKINFGKYIQEGKDIIKVDTIGDTGEEEVPLDVIAHVMSARIEEIFVLLNKKIEDSNFKDKLGSGIVLTGGFTNFYHIKDIAQRYFNMPVRVGKPKTLNGLFEDLQASEFSTAVGLLVYAQNGGNKYEKNYNQQFNNDTIFSNQVSLKDDIIQKEEKEEITTVILEKNNSSGSFFDKLKEFFNKFF